ncbi:MAG: hypothetical protein KGD63_11560 [Candidatus Lokiarchaeota archaeon]|nr:hypothetical protein [Candidatus Lokiarchaeota archaeon]
MSNIYLTSEDMALFKNQIPSNEEIIYATYALIGTRVRGVIYRWNSPILISNKYIIFIQLVPSNFKGRLNKIPLYKTNVFSNYKHIHIGSFDFRPRQSKKLNESKADFKLRWKEFQNIILPHVINCQKEHLKVIESNKNNPEFYNKKDLKEMPYFGTEKALEKNIRNILPKLVSRLEKINYF